VTYAEGTLRLERPFHQRPPGILQSARLCRGRQSIRRTTRANHRMFPSRKIEVLAWGAIFSPHLTVEHLQSKHLIIIDTSQSFSGIGAFLDRSLLRISKRSRLRYPYTLFSDIN